uniref:Uncharacterized protein n=1 Tax=Candidozyma auris TaxID=498019 RepID=A0A0L0NPX5_CANAR
MLSADILFSRDGLEVKESAFLDNAAAVSSDRGLLVSDLSPRPLSLIFGLEGAALRISEDSILESLWLLACQRLIKEKGLRTMWVMKIDCRIKEKEVLIRIKPNFRVS